MTCGLTVCERCGALLSDWEASGCACDGRRRDTIRETLYAVACASQGPIHARDFVRHAEQDFRWHFKTGSAIAILSGDMRFCWAGKGLYGLYRHGLVPGARNLEQVARVVLIAVGQPLYYEVLDYCLKQMGYRYNLASLRNAVAQSKSIERNYYGMLSHPKGEAAEFALRTVIPVVPPRRRESWWEICNQIAERVSVAAKERDAQLRRLADPHRYGLNWEA